MDPADWSVLADCSASADAIGSAVTRIITSIATRLSLESPSVSVPYDSALPNCSISTVCLTPPRLHEVSADSSDLPMT